MINTLALRINELVFFRLFQMKVQYQNEHFACISTNVASAIKSF